MKIKKSIVLIAIVAFMMFFPSCLPTVTREITPVEVEYKDGFEIAHYENFSDEDSFEKRDIYLEGTISKIENDHVYFLDAEGHNWRFYQSSTDNHNFEKYINKKCSCYCKATYYVSSENSINISFSGNDNYRIIFEDNTIYSEYDNCTMHDYSEPYIAFGGFILEGGKEYIIFDLSNSSVRNIRFDCDKWYYVDGQYEGNIFHKIEVHYLPGFKAVYEMTENNTKLISYVNNANGRIYPLADYQIETENINSKINNGEATAMTEFVPITISEGKGANESTSLSTTGNNSSSASSGENNNYSGNNSDSGNSVTVPNANQQVESGGVWVPRYGGTKYHANSSCSNMIDPYKVSRETAIANGYTACARCNP